MLKKCTESIGEITVEPIVSLLRGNQRRLDDGTITYDWVATLISDEGTAVIKGLAGKFDRSAYRAIDKLLREMGFTKLLIKRSRLGKVIEREYV